MKKTLLLIVAFILMVSLFAGCSPETSVTPLDSTQANNSLQTTEVKESDPDSTALESSNTSAEQETELPLETEAPIATKGRVEIIPNTLTEKWTLEPYAKVSSVEDLNFYHQIMYRRAGSADDGTQLKIPISSQGKELTSFPCVDFDMIRPGVYSVRAYKEGINIIGLYAEDGTELIPCETASITPLRNDWVVQDELEDHIRFLYVVYGTEATENEAESFFKATSKMFAIPVQDGDIYYKGYARIYDLESRRFVPNVTIEHDSFGNRAGGSMFTAYYANGKESDCVYDADGNIVLDQHGYVQFGNGFFILDHTDIYDDHGELLFKASNARVIQGSGLFLRDGNTVRDMYGNKMFSVPDNVEVSYESGGVFSVTDRDAKLCSICDEAGNVLYSAEHYVGTPTYKGHGIWEFCSPDGEQWKFTYYLLGGKTVAGLGANPSNLVNRSDDHMQLSPWHAPENIIEIKKTSTTCGMDGVLLAEQDDGVHLIDCFTGEDLLVMHGFSIWQMHVFRDGCVYACTEEDTMNIYKLVEN